MTVQYEHADSDTIQNSKHKCKQKYFKKNTRNIQKSNIENKASAAQ